MKKDIIPSGVGRQSILSIATVIGQAALKDELYMEQAEVHGISQRGSDVQPSLRISDQPMSSDLTPTGRCDFIISLELMKALCYPPYLSLEGRLATNEASFINIPRYPTEEALKAEFNKPPYRIVLSVNRITKGIDSPRATNIVLLGATTPFLSIDYQGVRDSIRDIFQHKGETIVKLSLKALVAGKEIAENLM